MRRTLIVIASVLCHRVPAALAAPPAHKDKPEKKDDASTQTAGSVRAERVADVQGGADEARARTRSGRSTGRTRTRPTPSASASRVPRRRRTRGTTRTRTALRRARPSRTPRRSARRSGNSSARTPSRRSTGRTPTRPMPSGSASRNSRRRRARRELRSAYHVRNRAAAPVAAVGGRDEGGRKASFVGFGHVRCQTLCLTPALARSRSRASRTASSRRNGATDSFESTSSSTARRSRKSCGGVRPIVAA